MANLDGGGPNLVGSFVTLATIWEPFEAAAATRVGIVDQNGPWRDGVPPREGDTNTKLFTEDSLSRGDFDIPNNDTHVVQRIEVESDNDRVEVWIDHEEVDAANNDEDLAYPDKAVKETVINGIYTYDPVTVHAQFPPGPPPQWYPQVHAGHFYRGQDEYYLFAKKRVETVAASAEITLSEVARQGAPVIVTTNEATPTTLRQVSFFGNDATPSLSLTNTEQVRGTGEASLYLAYHDVFDVTVAGFVVVGESVPGRLDLDGVTSRDETYTVTYKVRDSFYVDNDYVDQDGVQHSKVTCSAAGDYVVTYEASEYDPATPVDVALNTLYTTQHQGFLYISFDDYALDAVQTHLSPYRILADGQDYMLVTFTSLDVNGNPKPNQTINVSTNFGTLSESQVVTDVDGHASVTLTAGTNYPVSGEATLTLSGAVSDSLTFGVAESTDRTPILQAVPNVSKISADGVSTNLIYGRVVGLDFDGIAGVTVTWRKARSIYDVFESATPDTGTVTTNSDGIFQIGPITTDEEPGYWFLTAEATVGGVDIGDVVYWYEASEVAQGVENAVGMPVTPVQLRKQPDTHPAYVDKVAKPVLYDEDVKRPTLLGLNVWLPGSWYTLDQKSKRKFGIDVKLD